MRKMEVEFRLTGMEEEEGVYCAAMEEDAW